MPKTPERKRSGSLLVSPEMVTSKTRPVVTSAAKEKNKMTERRKRRNYRFAPLNRLDNDNRPESSVLKSISVSQVRNTSHNNPKKTQRSKQQQKETRKPNGISAELPISRINRRQDSLDEEPTEEVIWKYSPMRKDFSDRVNSSTSDDNIQMERTQDPDPSSTPIGPRKLKSVLSFSNINDREQSELPLATLSLQQRDSLRSRGTTGSKKGSFRDIDDILGDIEGNLNVKPKLPRVSDLPSSPSGIQQRQKEDVEKDFEDSDFDNDDESLINILNEKSPEDRHASCIAPTISIPLSTVSSGPDLENELLDDSLIDYFEDGKNDDKIAETFEKKDEKDLDKVETQPSENLNIGKNVILKETQKRSEPDCTSETQEFIELAKSAVIRENVERFVILSVSILQLPKVGRQKVLHCIDGEGKTNSVIVRHPWIYLEFTRGDVIHIIAGQNVENKRLLSDDFNPSTQTRNDNLLILSPDILISATTVGNSIGCLRRSTIEAIFDDPRGEPNISMTIGNIVHELLQDALRYRSGDQKVTMRYLKTVLDSLLKTYSFAIFVCNYTLDQVKDEIMSNHATNILEFVNKFVQQSNIGRFVSVSGQKTTMPISIPIILDIEENIWSHIYGLKGFLDATVIAHEEARHEVVPLEVKTGKFSSVSHEVQGLIYTLLLKDKYEIPVDYFLLLQTRTHNFTKYPKLVHSIKHVIMARNQLATKLKYRLKEITSDEPIDLTLPPILQTSACDNCFKKESCMVLNALLEEGTAEESGLRHGEYEAITKHLSIGRSKNATFFKKYNTLITQEESSITHMKKQLFLLDSRTMESTTGFCLSNLRLVSVSEGNATWGEFLHEFKRNWQGETESQSLLKSQLNINDHVFISDEKGHFGLGRGRVTSITRESIKVCSKKSLQNPAIITEKVLSTSNQPMGKTQPFFTYRLDKDIIEQGLSLTRFNLLNLFLPPVTWDHYTVDHRTGLRRLPKRSEGGDERMRTFLVEKVPPEFIPDGSPSLIPYDTSELASFNHDQRNAIEKVMRARDYALILGMPGSGKTTVIAEIIKILINKSKKVLLTSYTHSAVDNILLKLRGTPINIIRLGSTRKIHPEIHVYQPAYQDAKSYEEILGQISSAQVVAATCLGLNDIFFTLQQEDFDYAILDEASQISMPIALGPLRYASRFVLVGDHYQLPPLVKNGGARADGLQESLFKMLCEAQPEAVFELTYQYRMCDEIAALSNFLIYSNKLKCGNEWVAKKKINLPHLKNLKNFHYAQGPCEIDWLREILDPSRKVVFLNYDVCEEEQLLEISEQKIVTNPGEADIIEQCVKGLIYSGANCEDVGVMTLYRAQLQLLKKRFASDEYNNLEILTADQFQGRDKESIIISLVRSNREHNAGTLLKELRRINVAMTRARSKLIIVGSRATVSSVPQMAQLMQFLHSRAWIYDLPHHFREYYKFPCSSSSTPPHNPQEKSDLDRQFIVTSRNKKDSELKGTKNIGASSQITKSHPIIKQTLLDF